MDFAILLPKEGVLCSYMCMKYRCAYLSVWDGSITDVFPETFQNFFNIKCNNHLCKFYLVFNPPYATPSVNFILNKKITDKVKGGYERHG